MKTDWKEIFGGKRPIEGIKDYEVEYRPGYNYQALNDSDKAALWGMAYVLERLLGATVKCDTGYAKLDDIVTEVKTESYDECAMVALMAIDDAIASFIDSYEEGAT